MARLPNPGSDSGSWGTILNDFLAQSHTASGGIKDNAIGASQVQDGVVSEAKLTSAVQTKLNTPGDPAMGGDLSGTASNSQIVAGAVGSTELASGAVTTTKIADGSVTTAKLAAATVNGNDGLRSLMIFYAPPNVLNAQFNDEYAAGVFSRFDDVVFGTGLEDPGSPYYASTTAIIQKIATLSPTTIVWGYIDTGVSTGNFSLATLQNQIDQWIAIGAKGIFCDVIGYAYGVSRSRQNSIINYIHSKGVGAILNVFNPDEVLSSAVDATYNPSGTATVADSRDVLLLESWVCNSDAYSSPYYATMSDIKTRADKARTYRSSLGIKIYAVNIIQHSGRTESQLNAYRGVAEALARTFRLDGSGTVPSNYSASGSDNGAAVARFSLLRPNPLRPTAPYILNGLWTQVDAPDLGITVQYDVGTHTWTQL